MQPGDPQKAMVADRAYPADVEVAARVRVDTWSGGDGARAGVSLAQGADGPGYNLVFRDGGVQFLDDQVAWGNYYPFAWSVGAWYRFKLRSAGGVLYGKVWPDGAAEPSGWMFTQSGWATRRGGSPGLNGGSGGSTASFDDVVVSAVGGQAAVPTSAVIPAARAASASQAGEGGSARATPRPGRPGPARGGGSALPWVSRHHHVYGARRVNQGSGR